ncbi:MAG: hypothetical protein CMF50_03440 [Legionellales bacterium]|nr:hypothetical protein [Legionellales bacterium]|tara:strand:+ start:13416 stop:14915 length:1500 start_codon:yes stop_codon:yes gene_type:complete
MLGVQSFPEMYTTILGWMQYEAVWDLLVSTGIAYLPFLVMLIRNTFEPYTSMGAKSASEITLRRIEVDFIMMVVIIVLAVKPLVSISPEVVSYKPVCGNATAKVGHSGTTYDKAFSQIITPTKVPLIFYLVIKISEGFTSAMNVQMGCVPELRRMIETVNMTKIHDPELQQETSQFYQQCFLPARSQYLREASGKTEDHYNAQEQRSIDKYGNSDTEWLGSHLFLETPGFYDTLHAEQPIRGFSFRSDRDWDMAQTNEEPEWGKPSCLDWWEDQRYGLHNRLLQTLPTVWQKMNSRLHLNLNDSDDVVKAIIGNSARNGFDGSNDIVSGSGYSHVASALGTLWQQLDEYPKLYAIQQATPIIRALLLMVVYALLPFALVFSGYRVRTMVIATFIIFSLIFWAYLWHFVQYVDQALISALYANWFNQHTPQATIADFIIGSMMVALPLFWFSLMGAFGVGAGFALDGLVGKLTAPASKAGSTGASSISSGAAKIAEVASL